MHTFYQLQFHWPSKLSLVHRRVIARLVLIKTPGDCIFLRNHISQTPPPSGSKPPYFKPVSNYTIPWTLHSSHICLLVIPYICCVSFWISPAIHTTWMPFKPSSCKEQMSYKTMTNAHLAKVPSKLT